MKLARVVTLICTVATVTACGGSGSDSDSGDDGGEAANGGTAAGEGAGEDPGSGTTEDASLASALATGANADDDAVRWSCVYQDDGSGTEFFFFADGTGRNVGDDAEVTPFSWEADEATGSLTATTSEGAASLNSIAFDGDDRFTANDATNGADRALACDRAAVGEGVSTEGGSGDDDSIGARLVTDGTSDGFSWRCTSPASGEHVYTFFDDGTGRDLDVGTGASDDIVYTVSEESRSIQANFGTTSFASFFWTQVSFASGDAFTASNFLVDDDTVECIKVTTPAPPVPEAPAPAPTAATCPCDIDGVSRFLAENGGPQTFVTETGIAGGSVVEIDLDGDSTVDFGISVRDTGIRDCGFDPYSPAFGVEDTNGLVSLGADQAQACRTDLDELVASGF